MKELPDILTIKPKRAKREWLKFMANSDFEIGTIIYTQARIVKLSIEMLILNEKEQAEDWTRRKLIEELDKFKQIYS